MQRTAREVAINALSTFIGGAILAGGAVALGWVGSDPALRSSAGVGAILLMFALAAAAWTASRPLDTQDDHVLAMELMQVEALIAARDERRAAESPEE